VALLLSSPIRRPEGEGEDLVTESSLQTGLDLLARGGRTYLQLDKHLRFLDIEEIRWARFQM